MGSNHSTRTYVPATVPHIMGLVAILLSQIYNKSILLSRLLLLLFLLKEKVTNVESLCLLLGYEPHTMWLYKKGFSSDNPADSLPTAAE